MEVSGRLKASSISPRRKREFPFVMLSRHQSSKILFVIWSSLRGKMCDSETFVVSVAEQREAWSFTLQAAEVYTK